jgi:hypothetical protein
MYHEQINSLYQHNFESRRHGDSLVPSWFEILAVLALFIVYFIADALLGETSHFAVNCIGPLTLTAILWRGAWIMLKGSAQNIWTALFWFRLSTGVYFGIGTCAVYLLNEESRAYIESFNSFGDSDIFKLNLVVTLSVALVLVFSRAAIFLRGRSIGNYVDMVQDDEYWRQLLSIALLFVVVGQIISYGLKVPSHFGWITGDLPGAILQFSDCILVGIFMLTLWVVSRRPQLMPYLIALVSLEMLMQLMLFNKSGILKCLMMFLLALLWGKVTLIRMLAAASVAICLYIAITPVVTYARSELVQRHGIYPAGFIQRFDILCSYVSSPPTSNEAGTQDALIRITYVNAATLVIREFDTGRAARWPELLSAVFVPRALWAEKPSISDVGIDLYEIGTGARNSSVGAGVFADAYWAMGWWGTLVYMSILGVILGLITAFTSRALHEGNWIYLPVVLMGLTIGFRTDGHYLSDVAGGTVILLGMYVVLSLVKCFWIRNRQVR